MRFVLRDSGNNVRSVEDSCVGSIDNVDFAHLQNVGLFRLHAGHALTDDMKESLDKKFKHLMQFCKYKVSMDTLSVTHVQSEEMRLAN